MTKIRKWLPVFVFGCFAALANADVMCTEAVNGKANGDATNSLNVIQANNTGGGCISHVGASAIIVASDNEILFDPFGFMADTTDAIDLVAFGGDYTFNDPSGAWVSLPTNKDIWVLPADLSGIKCGIENETTCEPIPTVDFNAAASAGLANATLTIFEPDGKTVSDTAKLDCSIPNACTLQFVSDAPEPSSLSLVGTVLLLVGLGLSRYRFRREDHTGS